MITNSEKMETGSNASSDDKGTFITGTKVGKVQFKDPTDSPTARAAKALAIMNNKEDEGILDNIHIEERFSLLSPGDQALEDISRTEQEMNQMFKELNELEDLIKGNKDLKQIENLMSITNETISHQTKAAEELQTKLSSIHKEAEKTVMAYSFYDDSEYSESKSQL